MSKYMLHIIIIFSLFLVSDLTEQTTPTVSNVSLNFPNSEESTEHTIANLNLNITIPSTSTEQPNSNTDNIKTEVASTVTSTDTDAKSSEDPGTVIESDTEDPVTSNETETEEETVTDVAINGTWKTTKEQPYREAWSMVDALKDIAYYLRAYKFNEYDRRYETNPGTAPRKFFKEFPRPPLRSLHWEVHKHCEPSFKECVEFLRKRIRQVSLRRTDDTAVVMQEQKWTFTNNSQQIKQVDEECKNLRTSGDTLANPFEGPLERFQWRVTASYFMCLYTMKQESELRHLADHCDNYANCLDETQQPNNKDVRADDSQAFGCALYSFCPDPCCPTRHIGNLEDCWDSNDNPCYRSNPSGQRKCAANGTENVEFRDIVLNRWNVTCRCRQGYEWNSRFGMCVDVDECALGRHNCDRELQACVNLAGSFRCACIWGHVWSPTDKECIASRALGLIKLTHKKKGENGGEQSESLIRKLTRFLRKFRKSTANTLLPDKIAFVSNLLFALVLK